MLDNTYGHFYKVKGGDVIRGEFEDGGLGTVVLIIRSLPKNPLPTGLLPITF